MKRGITLGRRAIAAFVLISIILTMAPIWATEQDTSSNKLTINLEDAVKMAVSSSHQPAKVEQSMKNMANQVEQLNNTKSSIDQGIEAYKTFDKQLNICKADLLNLQNEIGKPEAPPNQQDLINAKTAQIGAIMQNMGMLKAKFLIMGLDLPMTNQQYFQKVIKQFEFGIYDINGQIQNMQLTKNSIEYSIKYAVHQMYDSVLNMQDNRSLQQKLYDVQVKKNDIANTKFKNGQISDYDRYVTENDMQKTVLSLDSLDKNIENIKLSLKRQIGAKLTQEVVFASFESEYPTISLMKYDDYLNKALKNRQEILAAQNDLSIKKSELTITESYMGKDSIEWKEADEAFEEKNFALIDAINSVTSDIKLGYGDALKKQRNIDIAKLKQKSAEEKYNSMKARFEAGAIAEPTMLDFEMALSQAKSGYVKAIRDYGNCLYRLDASSGIGPKYEASVGGK